VIYLGIDPGQRTGHAWFYADDLTLELLAAGEIYDGADGFIKWWNSPRRMGAPDPPDLIVFEGFTLREGKSGVDITPRDVIGALKALAHAQGIPTVERPPAGRKKQVSDLILKRLGLYLPGEPNRNAREAVRHTIAYLKAQKHPAVLQAFQA
jgi:hypothetical protein